MANTSGRVFRRVRHSSAIVDGALANVWARRILDEGASPMGVSYDINDGVIQGRAFQDPVLKHTSGGMQICEVLVASNRRKPGYNGQPDSMDLQVIPMIAFGKRGEAIANHVRTGDGMICRVSTRCKEKPAKDGRIFRDISIVIEEVNFYTSTNKPEGRDKEYGDRYEGSPNDRGPNNQRNIGRDGWNGGQGAGQTSMGGDEDIPFAPSYI